MLPDWSKHNKSQQMGWTGVQRVAIAELNMLPMLKSALHRTILSEEGKKLFGEQFKNLLQVYESNFSLAFLRIGNFIRLGTELENFTRAYYMEKQGLTSRSSLKAHLQKLKYPPAIFQRVLPSIKEKNDPTLMELYQKELNIDLKEISKFRSIQEYFVHRHLYTHQNGFVDEIYLEHLEKILGVEERQRVETAILKTLKTTTIDDSEVFWFYPIHKRFAPLILDSKEFILQLPA